MEDYGFLFVYWYLFMLRSIYRYIFHRKGAQRSGTFTISQLVTKLIQSCMILSYSLPKSEDRRRRETTGNPFNEHKLSLSFVCDISVLLFSSFSPLPWFSVEGICLVCERLGFHPKLTDASHFQKWLFTGYSVRCPVSSSQCLGLVGPQAVWSTAAVWQHVKVCYQIRP